MKQPTNPVEYRDALGIRPFSPRFTAFTKAIYGVPLSRKERELFADMSGGRTERPGIGWHDVFANIGRGAGKDDWAKSLVNFECRFGGHELAAAPGQRIPGIVVCPLRNQSLGTIRMVQGEARLPFNARHVARETIDSVEYRNGCVAQVQTANEVAVVGDTLAILVLNEFSLGYGDDSASAIRRIEQNARPALRRMVGSPPKRIIRTGSSYIKDGYPWELYRDNIGNDSSDVLVVHGATQEFNPNVDPTWLAAEAKALGPILFDMHFGKGCWIDAITEGWFGTGAVTNATAPGQRVIPFVRGTRAWLAVDAAFSQSESADRFGWAVASASASTQASATPNGERMRRTIVHQAGAWKVDRPPREMAKRFRDEIAFQYGEKRVFIDQASSHAFAQLMADVGLQPIVVNWSQGSGPGSKLDKYVSFRTALLDGTLKLCDEPALIRDALALRGVRLPGGGEKLEVRRSAAGHGDSLSAAVMAATEAMERHGLRALAEDLYVPNPVPPGASLRSDLAPGSRHDAGRSWR